MTAAALRFSHDDQLWFAKVSGDFNPIHTDPLYARRTVHGRQVVHGVHLVFAGLEQSLTLLRQDERVASVSARFQGASFLDQDLSVRSVRDSDETLRVAVHQGDAVVASMAFGVERRQDPPGVSPAKHSFEWGKPAVVPAAVPASIEGVDRLGFDVDLFMERFALSARHLGSDLVGLLLACTRVAGMRTPGLNSLIVDITAERTPQEAFVEGPLLYRSEITSAKARPVDVRISAAGLKANVRTMFRPEPVDQPIYETFVDRFGSDRYQGWTTWIVGGSRGIGECLAKYLAAGGATVTITFAYGEQDARRVQSEISSGGGVCGVQRVDVLQPGWAEVLAAAAPTHVFYLASPKILPQNQPSAAPFADYVSFYVCGLHSLARAIEESGHGRASIYFPSSVFVDRGVDRGNAGFADYAVAKRLAETLGEAINTASAQVVVRHSRLPEILTDQTAKILPGRSQPALDFVADIVSLVT